MSFLYRERYLCMNAECCKSIIANGIQCCRFPLKAFSWQNTSWLTGNDVFVSLHLPVLSIKNASTKQDNDHFQHYFDGASVWNMQKATSQWRAATVRLSGVELQVTGGTHLSEATDSSHCTMQFADSCRVQRETTSWLRCSQTDVKKASYCLTPILQFHVAINCIFCFHQSR